MMDSQENVLVNASPVEETGNQEVTNVEEQVVATPETSVVENAEVLAQEDAPAVDAAEGEEVAAAEEEHKLYTSKAEVLERVKEIDHGEEIPQ